jgi:uncharacterized protein (DUF2062 family)
VVVTASTNLARAGPPNRPRLFGAIIAQVSQGLSPHHLALAVACGAACAFFPILGLATPLCLLVGVSLRLNHPVMQAINALTSPAYPLVVYGLVQLGERASGSPPSLSGTAALVRFLASLKTFPLSPAVFQTAGSFAVHAILGWIVAAALAVPLIYAICRLATPLLGSRRRRLIA